MSSLFRNPGRSLAMLSFAFSILAPVHAQEPRQFEGRWDMTVSQPGKEVPAWLEIRRSGPRAHVGRLVHGDGSARPISVVRFKDGKFSFAVPPQFEKGDMDLEFEGMLVNDQLKGTVRSTDGNTYPWVAAKAPTLRRDKEVAWDKPINLFNGTDLKGWHALGENQWVVEGGLLKCPKPGANLVSDRSFMDFQCHVEFRIPKGGNSGFYLRGRYEIQIADSKGADPDEGRFGAIYGYIAPSEMAAGEPGEWQTLDITLVGRLVTLVANGKTIINKQTIPGITGGAVNSREGEPGPFQIQGDHRPIEFRSIVVTPAVSQ